MTISKTVDASSIYRQYLGSPILGVPLGGEERLKSWPPLQPINLRTLSHNKQESCADVVLSSAGEWLFCRSETWRIIDDDVKRFKHTEKSIVRKFSATVKDSPTSEELRSSCGIEHIIEVMRTDRMH